MYLISLKSFCTGRATLKERKRQPSEWENKLLQLKLETRHSSPKTQSAHTVKVKLAQLCPTLCLFIIFFNLLCLRSPFPRLQG